jgi:hypothetical protein
MAERTSRAPLRLGGRVLVVDDKAEYRRIVGLRKESAGRSVTLLARMLKLFDFGSASRNRGGGVGLPMRGAAPARLIERVRAIRPDVTLVGHSSMERREKFAPLGGGSVLAQTVESGRPSA